MFRFLVRRLLIGVLTLWLVSSSVFVLAYWLPADPARTIAGERATQETVDKVHRALGLGDPLIVRYGRYMGRLVRLDLGDSYVNGGATVWSLIRSSLPTTMWLVFGAGVIWLAFGIVTGVLSATKARGLFDRAATVFVLTGISIPPAVLALTLMYLLFFQLRTTWGIPLFDVGQPGSVVAEPGQFLSRMALPWISLAYLMTATYTRLTRSSMLEVLGEDYIRTARAKGLPERRVVYRHGLRAALTPVITQFGVDIGYLIGGTLVTESVFALNGFGYLAVHSLTVGDTPTVIGVTIFVAIFVVIANLVVDILYSFLDPRVRRT
ncbi:MAG TPA: ABC transporter permease [Streptosporangiaceae bacterium]|jgi:peptide/nickel transport system permease protein